MEAVSFAKSFGISLEGEIVVKGKKEFLVTPDLLELTAKQKSEPFCLGIPLGESSPSGFKPSFGLLDLLKESDNKISITEDAQWLFTCGRDIFLDKVTKEGSLKKTFLVVNKAGEVLGLGKKEKDGKEVIIKNIFDRGDFLRREQKKKRRK